MRTFLRLAAIVLLVGPLAAACGGGAGNGDRGPDRSEGLMDEAKLREFASLFPAPPAGYTRAEQPGIYTSDDGSTIPYTYQNSSKLFTITIGFSNKRTEEFERMMSDEHTRDMWGFNLVTVAGRQGLSTKTRSPSRSDFALVVSNSRNVTVSPASVDLPDKALVQKVFESIDFKAIANKN